MAIAEAIETWKEASPRTLWDEMHRNFLLVDRGDPIKLAKVLEGLAEEHLGNVDELVLIRIQPSSFQVLDDEGVAGMKPIAPDELVPAARADHLLADEGFRTGEILVTIRVRAGDFHGAKRWIRE